MSCSGLPLCFCSCALVTTAAGRLSVVYEQVVLLVCIETHLLSRSVAVKSVCRSVVVSSNNSCDDHSRFRGVAAIRSLRLAMIDLSCGAVACSGSPL